MVDEAHMVADPNRGPGLEAALSKVLASRHRPQIIAMSATSECSCMCRPSRVRVWGQGRGMGAAGISFAFGCVWGVALEIQLISVWPASVSLPQVRRWSQDS